MDRTGNASKMVNYFTNGDTPQNYIGVFPVQTGVAWLSIVLVSRP